MGLVHELRHGARLLRKNPVFSATAIVTLALGIGVNATVFSVVNAFLLRSLPFEQPERLVHVWRTDAHATGWAAGMQRVSVPDYLDFKAGNEVFEDVGAFLYQPYNLGGEAQPEQVEGGRITASVFRVLGVAPLLGRVFHDDEERAAGARVVVLSHRLWSRHFGADPGLLGRLIMLDGERYEVVGVMPPDFEFPLKTTQFWVPLPLNPLLFGRDAGYLQVAARLKPGQTLQTAQANLATLSARLQQAHPERSADLGVKVVPLRQALLFFYDFFALLMTILALTAGLVQLMVCVNVANLLMARSAARTREIAVRSALGAGQSRLVRQFVVESSLLVLLSGVAGGALAWLLTRLAGRGLPLELYRAGEVGLDTRALAFTLAVCALTALFFGLAPGLRWSRLAPYDVLKEGAPSAPAGPASGRVLRALVSLQVGLSLVLLSGALIHVRGLWLLRATDTGFDPRQVVTAEISLAGPRYPDDDRVRAFQDELLRRVGALPGVEAAALVYPLPLTFQVHQMEFGVEGRPVTPDEKLSASSLRVTPDYFRALRIPLVAGRSFEARDGADRPRVAVINQALAGKYWPGRDPVGQRLADCTPCVADVERYRGFYEIVGVVGDTRHAGLWEPPQPQIYLPQAQAPQWRTHVVMRAGGEAGPLLAALRRELAQIDPDLPLSKTKTMADVVDDSIRPWTLATWFSLLLAAAALLLAAVGVYGVVACMVEQRTHELGVRLAVGAEGHQVVRLVLRRSLGLILLGVAPGILLSLALGLAFASATASLAGGAGTRLQWDLATPLWSVLVLLAGALCASYIPARRASRIDVVALLRGV